MGLGNYFFSDKQNHFDVQTDILRRDKVLFFLWLLVVFSQKTVMMFDDE